MKYLKYVREHFGDSSFPTFSIGDLRTALVQRGIGDAYLKRLVNHMMKSGEITRITRGEYTLHGDATVAGFAFRPFYYGLEDALRIRGLSMQGTNPIVMTTRNVRRGVRQFQGRNYVVYRIQRMHFFGYTLEPYMDFWIPVSDLEKTVIDMVYLGGGIRDELWPGILKALDRKRLDEYLQRYEPWLKEKVHRLIRERSAKRGSKTGSSRLHKALPVLKRRAARIRVKGDSARIIRKYRDSR